MTLLLRGDVLRSGAIARGSVTVRDGVVDAGPARTARALPDGWIVCAGFVDLQVNGFAGVEVDGGDGALGHVAAALPSAGVTAFCPTLVSRPLGAYRRAAAALAAATPAAHAARPLGVHLEGPFLAPTRPGAHDPGALALPSAAAVDRLLAACGAALVTLAPELPGGIAAVRRVRRAGAVAAVGHTEADSACARAAIEAGARLLTHALNAMRGVESRRPSALTAFLADRRARVGLIGDGLHVAPEVAALIARAAGRRLVLVSDAVAAAGAPPGRYRLAATTFDSDGRRAMAGGRIAGAVAGLDAGPRTLVAAGVGRLRALAAAVEAPRRALGLPAGLVPGGPADLVVLDADLVPRLTLVGGRVAHADPGLPFDVPDVGARV